ncbi:hypothetical protein RHGRI_018156 [Rhododendron griersonianum]|uniref:Uncharacterized protein n=1 Tax=Rhododendron griersonianum TaxID=479676 RepID=A0AAV6K0G0_9ERIC|nr:hypothetical protein RHGRI_018156 [Rhododendron griersonianum]
MMEQLNRIERKVDFSVACAELASSKKYVPESEIAEEDEEEEQGDDNEEDDLDHINPDDD